MEQRLKQAYYSAAIAAVDLGRLRKGIMNGVSGTGLLSAVTPEPVYFFRATALSLCAAGLVLLAVSLFLFNQFENESLFQNPVQYSYLFY